MKRLVAVTVVLLMLCGVAFASVVDFASMSTDDLILLRQQISDEIKKRTNDDNDVLPRGAYVVGKYIRAGGYIFHMLPDVYGSILIIESEERYRTIVEEMSKNETNYLTSMEGIAFETFLSYGEQTYLSLKDGQVLVTYGAGILSSHKPSWAP